MLASAHAQRLHGPVEAYLGLIDSGTFPTALRETVENELIERAFAFLPQDVGDWLLPTARDLPQIGPGAPLAGSLPIDAPR